MSIFQFFRRKPTASVARERLQILLAHERSTFGKSDLIARLQEEILAVIRRHLDIDPDKVQIKLDRGNHVSTLEIDVEVPLTPAERVA
ncbi:MAG: cell division topological specificity factor MinE [Alphaproteobacteria bacterium]|nr:cell division topological specificity factor MinE [Alphaproteobacteria bacterium]